jgi:thioredoxin 1
MNPEILLRLLWTLVIIGAGVSLYWFGNRMLLSRAGTRNQHSELIQEGVPNLLYFTTPNCAPCKTIQRPAIQQLDEKIGNQIHIIEIDAMAHPEIANHWGVLSVPTTFVIDSQGSPRHINHGVATTDKLLAQIQDSRS